MLRNIIKFIISKLYDLNPKLSYVFRTLNVFLGSESQYNRKMANRTWKAECTKCMLDVIAVGLIIE